MSETRVCYTMPDGSVRILTPADNTGLTIDEIIAKDIPPEATNIKAHHSSEFPTDRTFRNAWVHDGEKLSVDMVKAADIHMDAIRIVRDEKLSELDVDWMKAMGQKNQALADSIEAQKQILRNIPQIFDLSVAATPEELKELWPNELKDSK